MDESAWPPAVRRSIATSASGDLDGFMDLWADDVVWRIGGNNQISGVHCGKEAARDVLLRSAELSGGTYRLEPFDVLADERHLVLMFHAMGERDGKAIDTTVATFVTIGDEGKWDSCWWLPSDQHQYNAFWS